ncbi:hypothetical protein [Geomonas sp.]|uniref:hypothetical protein n=1 Tax=Geomonas sp. TaxID=2651584 RepID=UPI002B4A57EB|nr:hypothetical protein [Geomonas sp.]HJV34206.1 hypothetical protein [Geomonas sp.]
MGESEMKSAVGLRHGWQTLALLALLAFSTGAGAGPITQTLKMPADAGQLSPSSGLLSTAQGTAAASKAESAPVPDMAVSRAVCLKEGEACNPLNDLCCPGYHCPGGLARTCAPKP